MLAAIDLANDDSVLALYVWVPWVVSKAMPQALVMSEWLMQYNAQKHCNIAF